MLQSVIRTTFFNFFSGYINILQQIWHTVKKYLDINDVI